VFPLTHFLRIVRGVLLKGNGVDAVAPRRWPIARFLLAAAVVALLLRTPFLVVVFTAAAAAALVRLVVPGW
jgi:hypothetical protein